LLAAACAAAALAALLARREARAHGGWLARSGARVRVGLAAGGDPLVVAAALGAALAGWAAEVLVALLCLPAFDLPAAFTPAALAVATTLSAAVSVSPGNAGVFELATVVTLEALGVDRERALAYALGFHLVHVLPIALLGLTFAARTGAHAFAKGGAEVPPDEAR
jgi:uncharacterized membrane protein YbhN (UPF0104 family)